MAEKVDLVVPDMRLALREVTSETVRAIYADEIPVGFVMLSDDPVTPEYFLWRLMIDAAHQGTGFGRRAIALVVDYVRTRPAARELLVSYHPGPHRPRDFYLKQGFRDTGHVEDGEVVLSLPLDVRPGPEVP